MQRGTVYVPGGFGLKDVFEKYVLELKRAYAEGGTEQSGRPALKTLLDVFAAKERPPAGVQHEPKQVPNKGAPDFKVTRQGMILGYVENKGIGENLDKVLKSDQITRYRSLSDNILLTDYLHFIWINKEDIQRETLCHATDLETPRYVLREDRVAAVGKLLDGFFSTPPEGIDKAEQLALALATRSRLLRDYLDEELARQHREHKEERLYGLFEAFRTQVFHELTLNEFADAFAQTLAYGLFLAKLNAGNKQVDLHNVKQFIPGSFRLIKELADFLDVLENESYGDIRWVVEEILSITNSLDLAAIHEDLSFRHRRVRRGVKAKSEEEARVFERDPFVYFYEDYLSLYDPQLRETRGVYYTPPPVVNFIVRAIDETLKDKDIFGIADGLADHKQVTVLDFACGTGTFLVEVFEQIFENIGGPTSGKADLIVRDHMLKNIYGFEYLIAPYTIAHLKLSQYLADRGHKLSDAERLLIYLTNTLEPIEPQKNWILPELTHEVEAAQDVKEKPILVITGNPPYSGHSRNMGPVARASIDAYKIVDGKPLGERNPKWLQDDYVKFIRFAQMKMDAVKEGIVGVITNHSYLSNPTFRGMRQSLINTFDQIIVLDLHGSTKPKETPPDGVVDENVFEIQKGVAISLLVKRPGLKRGIWYGELWGKQLAKYEVLARQELAKQDTVELEPVSPFYLFIPQNRVLWAEYNEGWPIPEIFPTNVLGFQTHRDHFAVARSRHEIEARVADLRNDRMNDQQLRDKYGLKDNRDWQLKRARAALDDQEGDQKKIVRCAYRPFDERWCWFGNEVMDYPRRELLDHVANRENVCLGVGRQGQAVSDEWQVVTVSTTPMDANIFTRGGVNVFPLYLYAHGDKNKANDPYDGAVENRVENISADFREWLDERFAPHYSAEEVMGYVYAVLHAPTYRERYTGFLGIDFPRIPFPEDSADFELMSGLGWELMQTHLLREAPNEGLGKYLGKGENVVETLRYEELEKAIWINDTQKFAPVPLEIWDFQVGGHQVLAKYLKDRKRVQLTLDEINNVENVANVIAFTIAQMTQIDEAYRSAFPDQG